MDNAEREFVQSIINDKSNARMLFSARKEWEEKLVWGKEKVREMSLALVESKDGSWEKFCATYFLNLFKKWVAEIERHMSRLKFQRKVCLGKDVGMKNEIDLEAVKEIPIGELLSELTPVSNYGNRIKYLCPLHKENTASFVWYKDTNSWYCYGCGVGGSNIDIYMQLYNVDFKNAINKLSVLLTGSHTT